MAEKQWLPPSPILGSKHMIDDILGPVFPLPPLDETIQTADGVRIETSGGEVIEIAHN